MLPLAAITIGNLLREDETEVLLIQNLPFVAPGPVGGRRRGYNGTVVTPLYPFQSHRISLLWVYCKTRCHQSCKISFTGI